MNERDDRRWIQRRSGQYSYLYGEEGKQPIFFHLWRNGRLDTYKMKGGNFVWGLWMEYCERDGRATDGSIGNKDNV